MVESSQSCLTAAELYPPTSGTPKVRRKNLKFGVLNKMGGAVVEAGKQVEVEVDKQQL